MSKDQREDFERRLLALVRNQMDSWDERFPDGWEITDFVVTARGFLAPDPGGSINPWAGGPYPGWYVNGWTRGSSPSWLVDVELLQDALDYTTRQQNRDASDESDDGSDDAADEA